MYHDSFTLALKIFEKNKNPFLIVLGSVHIRICSAISQGTQQINNSQCTTLLKINVNSFV